MPLIKRDRSAPAAPSAAPSPADARAALGDADPERRWAAARALAGDSSAVEALAQALALEPEPRILEAIFTALIRCGGDAAADALVPFLRSDDPGLRSGAVEALQSLPQTLGPRLAALLADPDPDVRILATELARPLPVDEASELLAAMLDAETHPNACGAAVEVLAELGTTAALPALRRCAGRFANDPFLPFAIEQVIARIDRVPG